MPQSQQEIQDRLHSGLDYNTAASTVYQDIGRPVNDLDSWVDYQAIEGSMDDEHVVVSLQYVEEGLLTVDLVEGQGAFGDDLAIEVLATEYQREIFVVCPRLSSPLQSSLHIASEQPGLCWQSSFHVGLCSGVCMFMSWGRLCLVCTAGLQPFVQQAASQHWFNRHWAIIADLAQVQAHGGDSSTDEDPALFFLPHRPFGQDGKPGQPLFPPLFLLMKGSDWRGAGAGSATTLTPALEPRAMPCTPFVGQQASHPKGLTYLQLFESSEEFSGWMQITMNPCWPASAFREMALNPILFLTIFDRAASARQSRAQSGPRYHGMLSLAASVRQKSRLRYCCSMSSHTQ